MAREAVCVIVIGAPMKTTAQWLRSVSSESARQWRNGAQPVEKNPDPLVRMNCPEGNVGATEAGAGACCHPVAWHRRPPWNGRRHR